MALSSPCCDLNLFCLEYEYLLGSWCTLREQADSIIYIYILFWAYAWERCRQTEEGKDLKNKTPQGQTVGVHVFWRLRVSGEFCSYSQILTGSSLKPRLMLVYAAPLITAKLPKINKQYTQAVSLQANLLMKICGSGCLVIIGLERTQKPSSRYCK